MNRRVYLFWSLFPLLLLLTGTYLYLVSNLIFAVVQRQNYLDILKRTQAEVVLLEAAYLKKSDRITLDFANALGYKDVAAQITLVRRSP